MIHGIPIIGTAIAFVFAFFCAIPFWVIWNRLGPYYFEWLPTVWLNIPFWDVVGLFMLLPIVKWVIAMLTPGLFRITNKRGIDD